MKKKIIGLVLALLTLTACGSDKVINGTDFNRNNIDWNVRSEQFSTDGRTAESTDNNFYYSLGEYLGHQDVTIRYAFSKDTTLSMIFVYFPVEDEDEAQEVFNDLAGMCAEEYGKSVDTFSDSVFWEVDGVDISVQDMSEDKDAIVLVYNAM